MKLVLEIALGVFIGKIVYDILIGIGKGISDVIKGDNEK